MKDKETKWIERKEGNATVFYPENPLMSWLNKDNDRVETQEEKEAREWQEELRDA